MGCSHNIHNIFQLAVTLVIFSIFSSDNYSIWCLWSKIGMHAFLKTSIENRLNYLSVLLLLLPNLSNLSILNAFSRWNFLSKIAPSFSHCVQNAKSLYTLNVPYWPHLAFKVYIQANILQVCILLYIFVY